MSNNLVIVESPAKAKTIEKFLGKDFTVKSCFGHIRDLAKGDEAIDVANNFRPHYEVSEDKKAIVAELKKLNIVIVLPHPNDKRRNEYFLNPTGAWKGKSVDRLKAIKKIHKESGNSLQIGLFDEKSEKMKLTN